MHVYARCFVLCCAAHYIIVLIFWFWQRCISCLCIHSICTIQNYMCINSGTYMHPQCKSLHPLWSWSSYGCGPRRSHRNDEKISLYRVIHKSLRDFRTRLHNNQDRHGRKEHINRWRISPSFCLILQVLNMCTLGDADVNQVPATRVATRIAGTWLQDWHLPRHQGRTYWAPVR